QLLGASAETLAAYRQACAQSGIRGYWQQALGHDREESKKSVGLAGAVASYYSRLGDKEQAFIWLEKAYHDHEPWLVYTKISPVYDNLRSDPRFATFLTKLGLD